MDGVFPMAIDRQKRGPHTPAPVSPFSSLEPSVYQTWAPDGVQRFWFLQEFLSVIATVKFLLNAILGSCTSDRCTIGLEKKISRIFKCHVKSPLFRLATPCSLKAPRQASFSIRIGRGDIPVMMPRASVGQVLISPVIPTQMRR
ncbi:hypothetical protein ACLKA7_005694 [Drosophila subpalustris]